jgi:hypothetical protein
MDRRMDYSYEYIDSDKWDIIELPWKINVSKLQSWYQQVEEQYSNLFFSWRQEQYLKEKYHLKNIEKAFEGVVGQEGRGVHDEGYHIIKYIKEQFDKPAEILVMEVSWYCEKDIPCTPKWAGREDLYPEIREDREKAVQEKFKFGYFQQMYEVLGENVWRDTSIRKHQPNAELGKHIDGPNVQRLHIPVESDPDALFLYGEKLDRSYNLETGKAYLINAAVPHGTINNSKNNRTHLQTKPNMETLLKLANGEIAL